MIKRSRSIDKEIRKLEVLYLVTDDSKKKEIIRQRLAAEKRVKAFLDGLPGQEYLVRDGGRFHVL